MRTDEGASAEDRALKAYQEAFEPELADAVRRHRLPRDARVLDCPCGAGFYTRLLARHLRGGSLVAADTSPANLGRAADAVGPAPPGVEVRFVKADAYRLPFEEASFDLVWCAQSMISLDDPAAAVREMARVLRPGGTLAVLETDEYHHVLLPWPVGLEVAIHRAVRAACRARYGSGAKLAQPRKLRGHLIDAGLTPACKMTVVADRAAPFGPKEREFLGRHFEQLRSLVRPELTGEEWGELVRLTDPDGPDSLLTGPDVEMTCLAAVARGTK